MLWWTTQNLLITTLLAGIVWCACRLMRFGPVWRHALWMVVLVKLLTPPLVFWPWSVPDPLGLGGRPASVVTRTGPRARAPAPPGYSPVDVSPAPLPDADSALDQPPEIPAREDSPVFIPAGTSPPSRAVGNLAPPAIAVVDPIARHRVQRLLPWLAGVWIAGGVAVGLLQGIRILKMLKILRRAQPAHPGLLRDVEASARRLGIRPVAVRVAPGIDSPVIWALRRPVLLWPEALPAGVCEQAIRGLIVHELAHVKRRDHWVGWMELLAGCVWWWDPLFWYVRHQLRESAELACDAWVVSELAGGGSGREGRRAYAEALLAVCECSSNKSPNRMNRTAPMPAVGVSTGGRRFLERRLAMIFRDRVKLRLPRVGLLSVGLMALCTLPAWSQYVPEGATPVEVRSAGVTPEGWLRVEGVALAPVSPPEALPKAAREVLDQLTQEQDEARREAHRRIEQARADTIQQLKELQDRYTRAGQLDEAVAVRDAVRRLQAESAAGHGPRTPGPGEWTGIRALPDPGNLTAYRDKVGQSFYFDVTGSTEGNVWGNVIYTYDSRLAAAAVHAGVLSPGQRGVVEVTILPGRNSYAGSNSNGVDSQPYGEWPGSYAVQAVPTVSHRGGVLQFKGVAPFPPGALPDGLPGAAPGSPMPGGAPALPDARPGGTGGTPPSESDHDTSQNGPAPGAPLDVQQLRDRVGQSIEAQLVGSTLGQVWGTDVYTDDSSPAAAAVHAGVLRDGESGHVRITILPGKDAYEGSEHNGVASQPWQAWGGSFRIERAGDAPQDPGRVSDDKPK